MSSAQIPVGWACTVGIGKQMSNMQNTILALELKILNKTSFLFKNLVLSKVCTRHNFLLQRVWKGQMFRLWDQIWRPYSVYTKHHGSWAFQKVNGIWWHLYPNWRNCLSANRTEFSMWRNLRNHLIKSFHFIGGKIENWRDQMTCPRSLLISGKDQEFYFLVLPQLDSTAPLSETKYNKLIRRPEEISTFFHLTTTVIFLESTVKNHANALKINQRIWWKYQNLQRKEHAKSLSIFMMWRIIIAENTCFKGYTYYLI